MITASLIAAAFFVGLIFGAGIFEAGARPQREKTEKLISQIEQLVYTLRIYEENRETATEQQRNELWNAYIGSLDMKMH
jgi:hypothetical protein